MQKFENMRFVRRIVDRYRELEQGREEARPKEVKLSAYSEVSPVYAGYGGSNRFESCTSHGSSWKGILLVKTFRLRQFLLLEAATSISN